MKLFSSWHCWTTVTQRQCNSSTVNYNKNTPNSKMMLSTGSSPSASSIRSACLLVTLFSLASLMIPQTTATTDAVTPSSSAATTEAIVTSSVSSLLAAGNNATQSQERLKGGRCPNPGMDTRLCRDQADQCNSDADCGGESLCCHTGCNRVCILPVFTACEQVRSSAERRARSLDVELAKEVQIPDCDPETGGFKQVQCDPGQSTCYCVDHQGFELPGTRVAGSREMVNCSNPRPCNGPMCRMLCPHGFHLDENGCEICECRNVCKGVKCPGETQCEVEEVPCTVDPCPPVPSCKQPRTLDSLCTFGAPLLIPETGNPFLCGKGPGQPTCPAAFDCNVKTGDDYGVCCASNKNFEKPGSCPVVATTMDEASEARSDAEGGCQSTCRHDLDCPEMHKCCFTEGCGKSCMQPANSTICRQQRHIAELLSTKELDGKGYIPQCDDNGNFVPRQCSRNGKICWCVSPIDGKNFPSSLGPAENVNCSNIHQRQRAVSPRMEHCDRVICSGTCEFGFKMDEEGCPTCDCIESPCDLMKCPSHSVCEMAKDPSCNSDNCLLKPTCLSENLFVNPCTMGTPLSLPGTQKVITCSETANTCPSSHICVMVSPNKAGLCCVNKPRIEPTKAGMCPFISPAVCNSSSSTVGAGQKGCMSDNDCEHSMKCCSAGGDCTICADPLLKQDLNKDNKMMTMCQYISESMDKVGGVFSKFRLAMPRPQCKDNGAFEEIQCDENNCMCVDENGAEIPGTLEPKGHNNLTRESCIEARVNPKCLEMNCRLGCDFGYETLDGCKICECRNPCNSVMNLCSSGEQCEMVDIDCWDGNCPPLPFCVPENLANGQDLRNACPKGATAFVLESNETLTCNPRARMLQCPDDYYCHDIEQAHDFGVCCPIGDEDLLSLTAEERDEVVGGHDLSSMHDVEHDRSNEELEDDDDEDDDDIDNEAAGQHNFHQIGDHIFLEGTNALARSDDSLVDTKIGQCPYLFPVTSGSCDAQCHSDTNCEGESKCCVNSCGGTHCTRPLLLTACQHQKSIIEHIARENGIPAKRFFIPQCDEAGEYMKIQSFGKFVWCVDSAGHEIQGTRVPSGKRPNCQRPSICPLNPCSLQCEFGYQLDVSGCPVCQCKQSPCEDITCDKGEECRMMQLNCISEPCPPVPLCLPKLENPCPFGEPLRYMDSQERVTCGPTASSCPSSHKCHLSPFGEYAVCCPKPKEVCFEKLDFSSCSAPESSTTVTEKWFFNSSLNECQNIKYDSDCILPGARPRSYHFANLFDTKSECLSICPALTHCERTREKNMELRKRYQHFNYMPNCDPQTGEWNPTQCFDEVGMCWCVNKKGEPIKGTMTNGTPKCQSRRGRLLGASSSVEPLVCDKGVTVHKCNVSLCDGKVCLGHPDAKCYINPCGGCQEKWMTEDGSTVDCNEGLTKCQQDMQRVVNSQAQRNTLVSIDAAGDGSGEDIVISESKGPMSNLENSLTEIFLSGSSRPQLKYHEDEEDGLLPRTESRTEVTPIFGNFGGHKIIGLTASMVTFSHEGGPSILTTSPRSPSSSSSEEKDLNVLLGGTRKHGSSRATSIADILADMMRAPAESSTELASHDSGSLTSPEFIDLMPSSSQLMYRSPEHIVPPPMSPMRLTMGYGGYQPQMIPLSRGKRSTKPASMEEGSSAQDSSVSQEESFSLEETSANPEILVSIIPRRRPGACPPPSHVAILNLISGACRDECDRDHECDSGMKCCISQCGLKCLEVQMIEEPPMQMPQVDPFMGLGMRQFAPSTAASDSFPSYLPEDDYDDDLVEPARMVVAVPQCSVMDNEYSPVQSQGELSWCVSPEGLPLHDTLTRGKVQCERNGTVVYRQSLGPICPDRSVKPMICTDQCLHATCKLHPEAVCVMDVCGNCKPSFFRPSTGEAVECEEKCSQPPADPGYCRAFMPRFTYNATAGKCEEFIFGGCHGNDNNFKTMDECQRECEQPAPVCQLPMKVGPCRASKLRWFFNRDTQTCEQFWYSGCGGNANNFATREQCDNRCPDVVLCPYLNDGEMKSCSRTEACRNVSCINTMNPDEYICHVDPCTCEATLKDVSGKDITCPVEPIIVAAPKESNDASTETAHILEESVSEVPLEAENTLSLQVLMDISSLKSKCMEMAESSRVKCDPNGHFMPVQCPFTNSKCHCVDEAGNHLENSPIFPLGSQSCEHVPVRQIDVILNFPTPFDSEGPSSVQVGVEAQDLLRKMDAHLMEDKVEVEILPESTNLRFTLVGNNKVDISHNLEEMVRKNIIGLREHGQFVPADMSLSRFSHMVDIIPDAGPKPVVSEEEVQKPVPETQRPLLKSNPVELDDADPSENEIDDASVSAESLSVDAEYNIVAVLLTVVVAMSVLLAGFGMFLALQKKKHTGSYPKKPFDSLAFTSQIYDFESTTKKVPLDLPTFKATPPTSSMPYEKSNDSSATSNNN